MARVPRRQRIIAIFALVLAVAALLLWADYRRFIDGPIRSRDQEWIVTIEPGMGARAIADALHQQGLIDSPNYLKFFLWHSGLGGRLQSGRFVVPPDTGVRELVAILTQHSTDPSSTRLTFSPGLSLYELADILHQQGIVDGPTFLARATDPTFTARLGVPAATLEGYLAPGRYYADTSTSVDALLNQMHLRFRAQWAELARQHPEAWQNLRENHHLGDHELLTLASIVEKEAVVSAERPVIARVFLNRLRDGMRLQSDPTCIYPRQSPGERPSPQRCRDPKNPYSTYVIEGLPPGPIAMVRLESVTAILDPYDGPQAQALTYFVARNDGSWRHYFSTTYEEHQRAVDHFLKGKGKAPRHTPQPAVP